MREILNRYTLGELTAVYRREGDVVELLLVPAGSEGSIARADCAAEPLIQAKLTEDDAPAFFSGGRTMRNSPTVKAMRYAGQTAQKSADKTVVVTKLTDPRGLAYTHTLTLYADNPAAEVVTSVENTGSEAHTLEMLSSFTLGSLSPFSAGLAPVTLKIHRLRSTWSAEGRLVTEAAEDLQLEPSWKCYSANSVRFGSVGSFPVRGFVPFCAVEDTAHGVTWAAATTQGSSWQMELYRQDFGLSLSGGVADREFGAWCKTLAPGACFTAPKAVLTAVRGGVDTAAQVLAENTRRAIEPLLPASEKTLPVLFNEFCSTWGKPTEETILRHVRALKGKNLGFYVIDAGWYDDDAFEAAAKLGRWELSRRAFPHGLKYVVDAIHNAGMKAGIWFEFEMAGRDEPDCFTKTDWLLTRDGQPITAGDRRFWDMRKPEVQEYLAHRVIDFLRSNGIDYMKVDYNETIGLGCDGAESLGEGLYEQILASQHFFCPHPPRAARLSAGALCIGRASALPQLLGACLYGQLFRCARVRRNPDYCGQYAPHDPAAPEPDLGGGQGGAAAAKAVLPNLQRTFGAALLFRRAGRPLGSAVDCYGRRHGILRQGGLHHRPRRQPAVWFPHRQLPRTQGLAGSRAAR